jgi:hypothetical protein
MGYPPPVFSAGCAAYLLNPNPSTWVRNPETSVVPMDWNMENGYFDHTLAPVMWDSFSDAERDRAVSLAGSSQQRALTAWALLLFALIEQIVQLLITIAMGVTFISFGIAVLFAFFKRTESIALNVLNQWIELIIQTLIIALIQALVMGFFLAGAATGSAIALVGIGIICLVFIFITMWSGVKAVWNSFNRLFNAMGQVTGQVFVSPTAVAGAGLSATAGLAMGSVSATTSMSASALAGMTALNRGASIAQTAGLMLGGSSVLTSAARTLAYLPGVRNTSLGDVAEQFTEGSMTRQVAGNLPIIGNIAAPLLGTMFLTDRDPARATYDPQGRILARPMLVPAVGDTLESWTVPYSDKRKHETTDELNPAPRMGWFTPMALDAQAEVMNSNNEEMEQHLSGLSDSRGDSLNRASAKLEQSADALLEVTRFFGQLQLHGHETVGGVVGDVIRSVQTEPNALNGLDYLTVGQQMAQVMGITPQEGQMPIQDVARFGLFINEALRLGISGVQAEQLIREVSTSPTGKFSEDTRASLIQQVQTEHNLPYSAARQGVNQLEHTARHLPNTITAVGSMDVRVNVSSDNDTYEQMMQAQAAMGGSGQLLGGQHD